MQKGNRAKIEKIIPGEETEKGSMTFMFCITFYNFFKK